jgi:sec-independent protein translocase protein TatA
MNFFGIGLPEMVVIAAIGLLVFGPKRLPELGRTLGRTLKGFQSASREFEQEFRNAIDTETAAPAAGAALAAASSREPAAAADAIAPSDSASDAPMAAGVEMAPEAVGDVVAQPPPAG